MRLVRSPAGPASARAPENQEAPRMSATPYPPTGDPAVLSAMGGLTAGFGMGPGDPPLHGRAHAGRSRKSIRFPVRFRAPWGPHGVPPIRYDQDVGEYEELGLLVLLA